MQHLLRTVPGLLNAIYEISDIICLFGRNPCFLGLFFEFQSSKFAKSGSIQCSVPPSGLSEHHCITSNLELERFLWSHPSAPTKFKSRNLFEESACQKGPKAENSETMCKADSASKPTVTETGQENCTFREISSAEVDDKDHREVVKKHEANGVVIFGAFVAGSLVGIIIAAPVIVVLLLGAGVAALTRSSSKAGKVARQVGKVSSDVLLIIFRKWREMNNKYRITDKMADAAKRAASKVKEADRKRGITKSIRDKASALWREIDQRTRVAPPQAQVLEAAPSVKESVAVTDGTVIPFDGRMETGGAYAVDHASVSKSFNA